MRGSPVVPHTSRIPRFGARCWLRRVRRSDLGRSPLPPSFLSSSPANNRAGGDWPSRKQAQGVGAARSLRRGHGPARLDGQATAATVAGSAMKEGKDGYRPTARGATNPRPRGERPSVPWTRLTGGDRTRSATSVWCTGRSGAACSAVCRGAKPARRGGLQSRPLEWAQWPLPPVSKMGAAPPGTTSVPSRPWKGCQVPRRSGDPAPERQPVPRRL